MRFFYGLPSNTKTHSVGIKKCMRKAGTPAPQRATKASKAETIAVQLTLSTQGEQFTGLVDSTLSDRQRQADELKQRIQDYKERANMATRDWTYSYKELRDLPPVTITPETATKAETLARQFARHVFIDTVTVTADEIIVYTKLLFSQVRTEDGSRTLLRRCIGAYKISIARRDIRSGQFSRRADYRYGVKIDNLLYVKAQHPHWAVESGRMHVPCGVKYNEQLQALWYDKDWYNFIDLYIQFLRFSGDDGAYTRSHRWINNRLAYLPQLTTQRARERGCIATTRDARIQDIHGSRDNNGDRIYYDVPAGGLYRVLYTNDGNPVVDFEGHHVCIPREYYAVIKHKLFTRVANLEEIDERYLKPLDRLVDGSTLSQAMELITI